MRTKDGRFASKPRLPLLGLAAAAMVAATVAESTAAGPLRCEIQARPNNGMIVLEAVVHPDRTVSGSYRFRVTGGSGSGRSDIRQSGDFNAVPPHTVTLGMVTLGHAGALYEAVLEVTSNGATVACERRIGGTI